MAFCVCSVLLATAVAHATPQEPDVLVGWRVPAHADVTVLHGAFPVHEAALECRPALRQIVQFVVQVVQGDAKLHGGDAASG